MRKHMQLTNKGISLYNYEMQIKTTIKYHCLHYTRMIKIIESEKSVSWGYG